jgi:hypothetical protein
MTTEDGECVTKVVTLPASLVNTAATVEIWYHAYVPKGHLVIDIEPVETVEDDMPTDEETDQEAPIAAYLKPKPEIVGIGDSLDYVGEDKPAEEISEEMAQKEQDAIANLKKEKFDKDKAEFESLGRTFTGDFSE